MKKVIVSVPSDIDNLIVSYQRAHTRVYKRHISKANALILMMRHGYDSFQKDVNYLNEKRK